MFLPICLQYDLCKDKYRSSHSFDGIQASGYNKEKKKEKVNIMSEIYLDLPSRLEDAFPEIDNDIMMELRNENEEYSELLQKISDLKQKTLFLSDLLDGSGEIRLTAEEHAAFTQYLHLVRQRDDMERQQIYFRGHTDAVAYLKKIKTI